MFGKERRTEMAENANVGTILLEGSRIQGDLRVPGDFRIDGSLEGSLEVDGALWVGPTAQVTAAVRAHSASIAGLVRGDVRARGAVELLPGSRLEGDVYAMSFRIEDGAAFLGKCHMGEAYVLKEMRR